MTIEELLYEAVPIPPEWWATVERELGAPFPWFGGKSRAAPTVWERFGEVVNYVEPFAGSLAVLLGRPHAPTIETVNDIDGHLANFWRSVRTHPEAVAEAADWPVNEVDLHARHRYLTALRGKLAARLLADPDFCSPRVAGWWVWGLCAWIGSGWCSGSTSRKLPLLTGGAETERVQHGKGVHARGMRLSIGGGNGTDHPHFGRGVHGASMRQQLPDLAGPGGVRGEFPAHGRGVHRGDMRAAGKLPAIGAGGNGQTAATTAGTGVHGFARRSRLPEVFAALAARLRYTRVTCGDFERILSPAVTWRHGLTGVFLDPPYPADAGSTGGLYTSAREEREVFDRAFRWALANGGDKRMRIALCYYEGTLCDGGEVSSWLRGQGWDIVAWKAKGGYGGQSVEGNANAARERIAFSPACLAARQGSLPGFL